MIEDAVESLRDDMEETIQSLQMNFLRQMQRQTDEVAAMLDKQRNEFQLLESENALLKKDNARLRRLF